MYVDLSCILASSDVSSTLMLTIEVKSERRDLELE